MTPVATAIIGLLAGWVLREYLPGYFRERGKNLATKQDIGEITRRVEDARQEYSALGCSLTELV